MVGSYPGWHTVSVRIAVVEVEDENCEQDTAGHHSHDKVEICSLIEISFINTDSGRQMKQKDYQDIYLLRELRHWLLASIRRQYS